jgi:hypothetical protein
MLAACSLAGVLTFGANWVGASTDGTLNNFDTVNPGTEPCHGFEIELEDCHSSDIGWTYNWNHYGVPTITDDDSVPEHVVCVIRWASAKNPDGSWSAYTAVPDGPISATNGHQFTNPSVNFGGEHFGVSYRGMPTTVRCHWLVDDGSGNLVKGPTVQISIPKFTYSAGQVRAAIEPVEPPEVPVIEFGEATWVRAIKTTTHNNNKVKLRDLVSDDPDDDDDINWRNGEPDEVEVEWCLLQEEFGDDDGGGNGALEGEPEDLDDGDEVITRRWEFYEYTGPYDLESHEALSDKVGPDDLHGVGTNTAGGVLYDLENTEVVGQYLGAQMSAFDVDAKLSLVEHLQDCEVGQPAPDRSVVQSGLIAFTATGTGDLPSGMTFDTVTGILSGTPTESGTFSYEVEASDAETPLVSKNYSFRVAAAGVALPPHSVVDTVAAFPVRGSTSGDGTFDHGLTATAVATPNPGFSFVSWSEQGEVVSRSVTYQFTVEINRSLVANFQVTPPEMSLSSLPGGGFQIAWPAGSAWILQETSDLTLEGWLDSTKPVVESEGMNQVEILPVPNRSEFFRLVLP